MPNTPFTLKVFAAISVTSAIVFTALRAAGQPGATSVTTATVAILIVLLLKGNKAAWLVVVILQAGSLLAAPFIASPWWLWLVAVVNLVCLLAPSSWRYIWHEGRPHRFSAENWDRSSFGDTDRPTGWYVDPASPRRVHYWNGVRRTWMGSAATPLLVRLAWHRAKRNS